MRHRMSESKKRLNARKGSITARLPNHRGFRPSYPGQKPKGWKKGIRDRQARVEKRLGVR